MLSPVREHIYEMGDEVALPQKGVVPELVDSLIAPREGKELDHILHRRGASARHRNMSGFVLKRYIYVYIYVGKATYCPQFRGTPTSEKT